MNILDIVLLIFLLIGLIHGFMRGLFVEIAALLALIAGVYGAIHFSHFAADFFNEHLQWDEKYINVLSFAITFIVIVLAITFAGKALTKLANFAALGILNKILGGVFGALKIGLILSIIIMVLDNIDKTFTILDKETKNESILYEPIQSLAPVIFPTLIKAAEEIEVEID